MKDRPNFTDACAACGMIFAVHHAAGDCPGETFLGMYKRPGTKWTPKPRQEKAMNALGLRIVENAALNGGDILVVHEGKAWLCHNGAWSEIPDYAARATALLNSLMESIPKYPA